MFAPIDSLLAPSRLAELRDDPDPARRPVVLDVRWCWSAEADRPIATGAAR